mgnify:CR=1 FL=1
MYNFKKFPGVTPPDPQHWLGGEGVKPPSGEILATGLYETFMGSRYQTFNIRKMTLDDLEGSFQGHESENRED